jgi:hypothetical protein
MVTSSFDKLRTSGFNEWSVPVVLVLSYLFAGSKLPAPLV